MNPIIPRLTPDTAVPQEKRSNLLRALRLLPVPYALRPMRRGHSFLPLLLALLLVFLLLPALGRAQTTEGASRPTAAGLIPTTERTFTPRIDISEQYDDNINLTKNNKKSSWITNVGPGFNLGINSEHTKLNLDCFGGYSLYANDSSNNTTYLGSTLSLDQQLGSRLSVRASDSFARTDNPLTTENGAVTNVAQKRQTSYANTGEAGLSYQFGPENTLTGGYRNRYLWYESDQYESSLGNEGFATLVTWFGSRFGTELTGSILRATFDEPNDFTGTPTEDYYDYTGGITLNYRWEPTRRVYVRYRVLEQRFDQTSPETGVQNYLVHQPTLGISLGFGPNTTFDADGGYWYQNVYGGKSQSGPTFNTALTTRQDRLTLRVSGNGGYDQSYFTSENLGFGKYYQGAGNADYQLTQALALFGLGSYRWEKYYNTGDQGTDRTDKTWLGTAGFRYTFLRYLTFSLEGTHSERYSTEKDQEFSDNRATARLTWAYGIPF